MAITRSQQAKQMLQDGGMLVKPSITGKRPGYRGKGSKETKDNRQSYNAAQAAANVGKASTASLGRQDPRDVGFDAREAQISKQYSGITPIGDDGRIIPKDTTPKAPLPKPKETKFQKFKRTFNPFPLATSVFGKISNSKLARINNAMQRQNYIDSLDLTNPEEKEEYDRIMNQLGGLGMDIIAGPEDLKDTSLKQPMSLGPPKTTFKTVDGVSALGDPGVDDVLGEGYDEYLNRFEPKDRDERPEEIIDPCKGPNPPAYCFIGEKADETIKAQRNLAGLTPRIGGSMFDFTQFAADGGRIGLKGGADAATESFSKSAGSSRPGRKGSVNVGAGGATFNPSGRDEGPDDRSTFEQTVNQRRITNEAKRQKPSNLENMFRTASELNYLRNLIRMNPQGLGISYFTNKIGDIIFPEGDLQEIIKEAPDQRTYNIEATKDMVENLPGGLIKDIVAPAGALVMSPVYDTIQGIQRGISDPNKSILEAIKDENILSSAAERFTGAAAPLAERFEEGGIASLNREAFLLGGIAKGLKKAVRGVKKIAKSPIGRAALIAGGGYLLGGGIIPGVSGKFIPFAKYGSSAGSGFGFGNILPNILNIAKMPGLAEKAFSMGTTGKALTGILGASVLAGLTTPKQDDGFNIAQYYADNKLDPNAPLNKRIAGSEFDFYGGQTAADGGRIGYQEGSKEPVAKKTLPLIDMDGMEKDYRETGGFVEMGRMEKADDVPARLSKNEFVFTADAVRNAGEGDIDKGAEVMYNMMKNLEAGGEVSEESQGLEGAREMFKTSQRLGEVL